MKTILSKAVFMVERAYVIVDALFNEDEDVEMAFLIPVMTGFQVLIWQTEDEDYDEGVTHVFSSYEEAEEFMIAHSVALRMS